MKTFYYSKSLQSQCITL